MPTKAMIFCGEAASRAAFGLILNAGAMLVDADERAIDEDIRNQDHHRAP